MLRHTDATSARLLNALAGEARRCLIVDDEPAMRTVLRRLMTADGFECIEVSSGVEALAALETQPVPLVLSDYHMPVLDGAELLRTVQSRWPGTAVVIITAISDVNLAVRCLDAGALDYLTKPFSTEELRARVLQALEKRRLLIDNAAYRTRLEERVAQQSRQYEELFLASLQSLADALEVKDSYTWGIPRVYRSTPWPLRANYSWTAHCSTNWSWAADCMTSARSACASRC